MGLCTLLAQKGNFMKRWAARSVILSVLVLFVLVPAVSAREDDFGTVFGNGEWLIACGDTSVLGVPAGVVFFTIQDRIPPGFTISEHVFIYSEEFGVLADYTDEWDYIEFSNFEGGWSLPVPADGYTEIVDEVYDDSGTLYTVSQAYADCTTGEINIGQSSIYGPKAPTGFELRSLSCSSAVLDAPGGKQVGDNAVLAGQSWYVNPTPKAGPDGENYTEIFVGGRRNGYIPTVCIGGAPSFSAE